jgi:hypothetical protein
MRMVLVVVLQEVPGQVSKFNDGSEAECVQDIFPVAAVQAFSKAVLPIYNQCEITLPQNTLTNMPEISWKPIILVPRYTVTKAMVDKKE